MISDSPCAELPDAAAVGPDHPQGRKCRNTATKASIEEAIKTFVAGLVNLPPEIVVLYFAGHGIRVRGKMFLVPSNANLDSGADLEQWCLSIDEIFNLLKAGLEDKINVDGMVFLVIPDTCQNLPGYLKAGLSEESLEPDVRSRPKRWRLCTAAARGQTASDGE